MKRVILGLHVHASKRQLAALQFEVDVPRNIAHVQVSQPSSVDQASPPSRLDEAMYQEACFLTAGIVGASFASCCVFISVWCKLGGNAHSAWFPFVFPLATLSLKGVFNLKSHTGRCSVSFREGPCGTRASAVARCNLGRCAASAVRTDAWKGETRLCFCERHQETGITAW